MTKGPLAPGKGRAAESGGVMAATQGPKEEQRKPGGVTVPLESTSDRVGCLRTQAGQEGRKGRWKMSEKEVDKPQRSKDETR